jgi:hypothetical protein
VDTIRWICTGWIALFFVSSGIGCTSVPPKQQSAPDESIPAMQSTVTPIQSRVVDLPVKEGTMPLAYLVETTGGVRVVDMTTHHPLAQTMALGRTIVSVDENVGVSIGGAVFSPGPLPADHRYGVFFDSGGFKPEDDVTTTFERSDPGILRKHDNSVGNSPGQPDAKAGANPQGISTTGPSPHQ